MVRRPSRKGDLRGRHRRRQKPPRLPERGTDARNRVSGSASSARESPPPPRRAAMWRRSSASMPGEVAEHADRTARRRAPRACRGARRLWITGRRPSRSVPQRLDLAGSSSPAAGPNTISRAQPVVQRASHSPIIRQKESYATFASRKINGLSADANYGRAETQDVVSAALGRRASTPADAQRNRERKARAAQAARDPPQPHSGPRQKPPSRSAYIFSL